MGWQLNCHPNMTDVGWRMVDAAMSPSTIQNPAPLSKSAQGARLNPSFAPLRLCVRQGTSDRNLTPRRKGARREWTDSRKMSRRDRTRQPRATPWRTGLVHHIPKVQRTVTLFSVTARWALHNLACWHHFQGVALGCRVWPLGQGRSGVRSESGDSFLAKSLLGSRCTIHSTEKDS